MWKYSTHFHRILQPAPTIVVEYTVNQSWVNLEHSQVRQKSYIPCYLLSPSFFTSFPFQFSCHFSSLSSHLWVEFHFKIFESSGDIHHLMTFNGFQLFFKRKNDRREVEKYMEECLAMIHKCRRHDFLYLSEFDHYFVGLKSVIFILVSCMLCS